MYSRDKILKVMREIYEGSQQIAPYVVIAQPRRDLREVPAQRLDGHDGLHIDVLGISHGFVNIGGEKVDVARNYLIEQVLQSGAKYLFFVGEDTVIPYDGFKILHDTAEKNPGCIVAGVYYIKLSNAMVTTRQGNWLTIPNVDPGQIIEAHSLGMDAMLIPVEVLQRMKDEEPELPFCCIGNNVEGLPFVGEDNFFCHRAHRLGVKILVNTDVQCLHMDLATGNYTAHPSVEQNLHKYHTNIKIGRPLVLEDKEYIDKRWLSRLPEGSNSYSALIRKLNESGEPVKLDMGCGRSKLDGFIGIDKYSDNADFKVDLCDMKLDNETVDFINCSHVLEHIPQHETPILLEKWYNALKVGGKIRVEVPDLEQLCEDFVNGDDDQRRMVTFCIYGAFADYASPEMIANNTASFHVWGFYPKVLQSWFEQLGFKDIKVTLIKDAPVGKNFVIEAVK